MDFNYTEEQLALQDTLARFIARDYDFEHRRELAKSADGFSRDAWAQFAELGLLALPLPEAVGGLGGNGVDTMLVMEQIGKGLLLEPFLSTVIVGGGLLADTGAAAPLAMLESIVSGELLLSLAHYEPGSRYQEQRVGSTARATAEGYVLNGYKQVVLDGPSADRFLVTARSAGATDDADGISLFLVDAAAPGLSLRGYTTQDGRRAADLQLDGVQVPADALIGDLGAAMPLVQKALDRANAALCAEAVGIMAALNEQTLEYLKQRKQFGVSIGKFQALQHRMADMVIATEQARSMAIVAAVHADFEDAAERGRGVSAAKAYICQQARSVGQQAVQLHGGMGVVDELIVSHHFKRLTMIGLTYGDADHHLGRFSDGLLAA